jgi:multiple sugar transport system ATP-binding protein
VNGVSPKDRNIAMVFQSYALYPHMTVRQNMGFGLKLRKFSREEIRSRVERAAALLGLTPYLDRKPKSLSGGERQRVALGRAIVRQPRVFLLDEPLSNLDAALRVQMRTEISKLHHDPQATMIYVTHDQVEAMTMADRIAVMKDGVIHQVGAPLAIYNEPTGRFVASFIGSPSINFLSGDLDGDAFRAAGLVLGLRDRLAAARGRREPAILGIRPEDLEFAGDAPEPAVFEPETLVAIARVVEPMGNEIFLHAQTEAGLVLARIPPRCVPSVGKKYLLRIRPGQAHLFSSQDGRNLLVGVPAATAPA